MDRELPVSVWPEWKITEKIGEGSFGKVYKAERLEQGKTFYSAIKVLTIPSSEGELNSVRAESKSEQATRDYFQSLVHECIQEVSTMEYFRGNSYIVSVEDYKVVEYLDAVGWDIYIRMEYLTSFLDYCAEKQMGEEEVIQMGIDLCRALECCQQMNIIHRDIKPENIFVSKFGEFKLGDFGIARELERTMSSFSKKGTYSYMAPEMYRGEKYDNRADIYSLGIVLYKLMNHNRLPFLSLEKQLITYRDKENALTRRMSGEALPPPADAGEGFGQVIKKACAYQCEERYQTASDFRKDLEALKNGRYKKKESEIQEIKKQERVSLDNRLEEQETKIKQIQKQTLQNDDLLDMGVEVVKKKTVPQTKKRTAPAKRQPRAARKRVRPSGLLIAVIVMGIAVCIAFVVFLKILLNDPASYAYDPGETQVSPQVQVYDETGQQKTELSQQLQEIKEKARDIVDELNKGAYDGIGSEEEGKIAYADENGEIAKVLIYPEISEEGCFEEYFYWEGELFFAYIWRNSNIDSSLAEGEQKANLYYYEEGELIRWIDEENICHDGETENQEYVKRGALYQEKSQKYIEEMGGSGSYQH